MPLHLSVATLEFSLFRFLSLVTLHTDFYLLLNAAEDSLFRTLFGTWWWLIYGTLFCCATMFFFALLSQIFVTIGGDIGRSQSSVFIAGSSISFLSISSIVASRKTSHSSNIFPPLDDSQRRCALTAPHRTGIHHPFLDSCGIGRYFE